MATYSALLACFLLTFSSGVWADFSGPVIGVIDGDTIDVLVENQRYVSAWHKLTPRSVSKPSVPVRDKHFPRWFSGRLSPWPKLVRTAKAES